MNTERKYFDLHTRGIGYVNRLRTVTPKKASLFWPVLSLHFVAPLTSQNIRILMSVFITRRQLNCWKVARTR